MELFLTCLTIFPWAEQGIHYLKLLHMHDYAPRPGARNPRQNRIWPGNTQCPNTKLASRKTNTSILGNAIFCSGSAKLKVGVYSSLIIFIAVGLKV